MKNFLIVILLLASTACWAQTTTPQKADINETVYDTADQMPQYPGGHDRLMKFLQKKIRYPAGALEQNIMGTVQLTFVVDTDGSINNIKIVKDIGGGCGDEAVRVINLMPKWIPGKKNGHPVPVNVHFPVGFELAKD